MSVPAPVGLWARRTEGAMLRMSLRTPQLTQITGMSASRKRATIRLSGSIGARFGVTSMPRESM